MDRVAKVAQHVGGGSEASTASFVGELATLTELYRTGMLTDDEFSLAKARLLRPSATPTPTPASAATVNAAGPVQMSEKERFLYDLHGFLHVPGHLSAQEVAELNRAFDENWDKRHGGVGGRQNEFTGMLEWPQPYCQPFRDLLVHPNSLPYLNTQFGQGWRMDHSPFMITGTAGPEGENPAKGGGIHGATSASPGGAAFYQWQNGAMQCGLVVFAFMLVDVNEGDGGLVVVPGSHKSNLRPPAGVFTQANDFESNLAFPVHNPPAKAGDLVIFNEATLHGTLPWRNTSHETRRLLYRYCPKHVNFHGGTFQFEQPDWVSELTLAQQAALEPPYLYNRVTVENDGSVKSHDQNASFGQLHEKVKTLEDGKPPVQSRWGTEVTGTHPPAAQQGRVNHGGLPTSGWGKVERNENGLLQPSNRGDDNK